MKKRYYIVIAALLFGASVAKAQDHIKLDLQKTIQLANDSSLEAFRTQNMYLSVTGSIGLTRPTACRALL